MKDSSTMKDSSVIKDNSTIKVWDPFVRIFHWSLVLLFVITFASEEGPESVHIFAGYGVSLLVLFRIFWGFFGTRYARFSNFSYGKAAQKRYLKSLMSRHPEHYTGHNPAGGLMVLILLAALLLQCFLGMVLISAEGEGPFAGTFLSIFSNAVTKEFHDALGHGLLLLIAVHISGVVVSSLLHRENLIRAMVTGKKNRKESPDAKNT